MQFRRTCCAMYAVLAVVGVRIVGRSRSGGRRLQRIDRRVLPEHLRRGQGGHLQQLLGAHERAVVPGEPGVRRVAANDVNWQVRILATLVILFGLPAALAGHRAGGYVVTGPNLAKRSIREAERVLHDEVEMTAGSV